MANVIINGEEIAIDSDECLNGIQATKRAGVDIPHYCWHEGLSVVASCRMCLVETGRRDPESGDVTMQPRLVPACQTPATDNTVFVTDSDKVKEARAMVEEDLLIRHPIDCPICDKAGECHLQDYHFEHGQGERRADIQPFTSRRRPMGDTVTLFVDRCVMCTRCVRFTREITGSSELMVVNRGAHEEIDVFPGYPLDNKLSGNVVDLCPVGALGDTDFLYSQRVWFMKKHDHVCDGCSTGCSITVEENQDRVYRLKPRENPEINQWWMCDDGRYGFKHVHAANRETEPKQRTDDGYENIEWSNVPIELESRLKKSGHVAALVSPHLTVEEAYLLVKYIRSIDSDALLAVGPIPIEGEDETFPNGFTIHAEKCPNRLGVEAIVSHFQNELLAVSEFVDRVLDGKVGGLWVSGGYKNTEWLPDEQVEKFAAVPLLVVQDTFSSAIWNAATFQLPGGTFAERQGSFVNFAHRLQSFDWAVRPPAGVMVEGPLYWRLLNEPGMFNARSVLKNVAREIDFFSAAAVDIPDCGIDLRVNHLAEQTSV